MPGSNIEIELILGRNALFSQLPEDELREQLASFGDDFVVERIEAPILDNPHDELAWHRVLRLVPGIGPATARRIMGDLADSNVPPIRRLAPAYRRMSFSSPVGSSRYRGPIRSSPQDLKVPGTVESSKRPMRLKISGPITCTTTATAGTVTS